MAAASSWAAGIAVTGMRVADTAGDMAGATAGAMATGTGTMAAAAMGTATTDRLIDQAI